MSLPVPPPSALHADALVALAALARHGSLGAAAAAIGMPRARFERLLRAQERRLGVALVTPRATGTLLTATGQQLHAHAGELLHALQHAEASARQEHGALTGQLRVQAPQALIEPLLLPLLLSVRQAHPGLSIAVSNAEAAGASQAPSPVQLTPAPLPPFMYGHGVGPLQVGLFCSPAYAANTQHLGDDLPRHALIHCSGDGQAPVWSLAGDRRLRFEPNLSVTTAAAALRAAMAGAGVVRCYALEARSACAEGQLQKVAEAQWPAPTELAVGYELGLRAPAPVRAFIDLAVPWLRARLAH